MVPITITGLVGMNFPRIIKTAVLILLVGVFCFEASKWGMEQWPEREEPALRTKVITLDNGYGYQIFSGDKLLIQQEFIPAVEGEKQFETKEDAKQVADMVMRKILKGESPRISLEELNDLDIVILEQ
ncbi:MULTISPECIES: DUF4907 domain-containing protein [Flavobacteriaceae]|uniref:DUF4907 domain-containing protein n=1 Tax=Flavobacteriaceae TaxID=49546 RepID=UPI001490DBC4|nr:MULTISPECIES: DUF4907 domain-containing protein [Allomuricauda]MDC6366953.1 DUF4907 domain-containing protein [Muricauda sp. AC10]